MYVGDLPRTLNDVGWEGSELWEREEEGLCRGDNKGHNCSGRKAAPEMDWLRGFCKSAISTPPAPAM